MSNLDKRLESLGRRLGSVVAATKLRVTEWGPAIQIRIHESVGGRISGQKWRLQEIRKRVAGTARRLHEFRAQKYRFEEIVHYIKNKYPNNPDILRVTASVFKEGGVNKLLAVLEAINPNALVVGSPEFDRVLFDLVSEPGDQVVIGGKTYQKVWVPDGTRNREVSEMGTMTIQAAVKRLAKLKAQKRLIEFLNVPLMAQGNRSQVDKEPIQTGNDIYYKNGGDELIEDLLQIFYDEILNAPSSDYVQKKRDPSQFPPKKKDPKHF